MAQIFFRNLNGTNKLDITHWIAINENNDGHLEMNIGTHMYAIYDITIDGFHTACRSRKMSEYKFRYKNSTLSCEKCKGKTRLDWIENASSVKDGRAIPNAVKLNFLRNPRGRVTVRHYNHFHGGTHHLSCPRLIEGYHICHKCLGTGLRKFGEGSILLKHYIPKGGKPWEKDVIDVPQHRRYR